jgi:hypothetical protein
MRLALAACFATLAGGVMGACSSVETEDAQNVVADAATAPDRTSSETGAPPDASSGDASVDGGVRMNSCGALLFDTELPVVNGDLELGCTNGMFVDSANAGEVTNAVANGGTACRVCGNVEVAGEFFRFGAVHPMNVQVGDGFEIVACVRDAPGRTSAANVRAYVGSAGNGSFSTPHTLTSSYVPLRISWTAPNPYDTLRGLVLADQTVDACFLVDDIRIFKVN